MSRVFISYRHRDGAGIVGRIYDRLNSPGETATVFHDASSLVPGNDYPEALRNAVERCEVLVAVITEGWLSEADDSGTRRLDDPKDWVRIELAAALKRRIPLIPVLIGPTAMPKVEELPRPLRRLAEKHFIRVDPDAGFNDDFKRLTSVLDELLKPGESDAPSHEDTAPVMFPESDCIGRWRLRVDDDMVEIRLNDGGSWTGRDESGLRTVIKKYEGEWSVKRNRMRIIQTHFGLVGFPTFPLVNGSSTWIDEDILDINGDRILLADDTELIALA